MPDFKYERDQNRLLSLGLDLNRPIDNLKPQKQHLLKNVRASRKYGRLEPRPGLNSLAITGSHSIRRLNDPVISKGVRVTGHGTSLYLDGVVKDTGYSGNPLALIPYRPPESPKSWMYVTDSKRMRKIDAEGNVHQIGLPSPTLSPTVALATNSSATYYKTLDSGQATTGWAATAQVSSVAATNPVRVDPTAVTITGILYDSGTSGWCSVRPSSMANIGEGCYIRMDSGGADDEYVMVQSTHPGCTSTTIANIHFDSGTAGECSIVLTSAYPKVQVDALLLNTTDGSTYARVLGKYVGQDGLTCLRATTATGSTWSSGDTLYAVPSFRCCTANTQVATHTLGMVGVRATFSATAGTGNITKDIHTTPIDLSTIAAGIPASADDYIHISFQVSSPTLLTQGRVMFDVTNQAVAGSAFASDYYYKTFRPNDLTISSVAGATITDLSASQREILRSQIEWDQISAVDQNSLLAVQTALLAGQITQEEAQQYINDILAHYGETEASTSPTSTQLAIGSTWAELEFKISDLIRVGTNTSSDLSAVYYIRLEFIVEAGALTIDFHSLGLRGGHGPDCGIGVTGSLYQYRYRARCTSTGSVSNWSPASRNLIYARRQQINVAAPAQYDSATEADVLEFQRFGGTLTGWHYVGQVANSLAVTTLSDDVPDDVASVNSTEGQVNYQPWPVIGYPVSGSGAYACGTTVTLGVGGSTFSTSWAPGTRIEINNYVYTVYQVRSSMWLELFESAGNQSNVAWRVPEPVVVSQPLYAFWGPLNGTMFACGDPLNPQRLYFTFPNVEGTSDTNYIDITSPSEPLMNGVIYNGRAYVFSSERLFQLTPGTTTWEASEIPNGRGLWSKWCFTGFQGITGPYVCFLSKDGIYYTDGGPAVCMTEADLNPLFPFEGNMGSSFNEVLTPRMDSSVSAQMRLAYYDNHLYFDYYVVS